VKDSVLEMIGHLKASFKKQLLQNNWMDITTKALALEKVIFAGFANFKRNHSHRKSFKMSHSPEIVKQVGNQTDCFLKSSN